MEVDGPPGALAKIGDTPPRRLHGEERPQVVVRILRARPSVLDADHQVEARLGPVVAGKRARLVLRRVPGLAHRPVEDEAATRGRADTHNVGRSRGTRVLRLAVEQTDLELGDCVPVCPASREAMLPAAIDRVGQVVLLPEAAIPRAFRALVEPQDGERVRDRILAVGVGVEPLEIVGDLLGQIRPHWRGIGIVRRRVNHVTQRPPEPAHLVVGQNAFRRPQAVAVVGAQHAVVRPERHLLGVIAIARQQVGHKRERRLVRVVGNQRALTWAGCRGPVLDDRQRRATDEVDAVALRSPVVPYRGPLVERHVPLGANAALGATLGLANMDRPGP